MTKLSQPLVITLVIFACAVAQSRLPLTNKEVISLVQRLAQHPEKRDEIVEEIRLRGIAFPFSAEQRTLVSTRSNDDPVLRWALEEAERRRANPPGSSLSDAVALDKVLDRTRTATLSAAEAMPDFLVRQLIRRYKALGGTSGWETQDNLTIAVGYRALSGEQYRVVAVNGTPVKELPGASKDYSKDVAPGVSSSGVEYVSALSNVFKPESETTFKVYGTDTIQGRRTLVYEYEVKQPLSQLTLRTSATELANVGSRGRVWIDSEINRVLRFEQIATEIPADFPITGAIGVVDYGWITIGERKYLLPTHSELLLTRRLPDATIQSRNEIQFSGYRRFAAELKVIDEIDEKDFPVQKPSP